MSNITRQASRPDVQSQDNASASEKKTIIEPKVLKGFRDSLPAQEIKKKEIIHALERNFSSYGFVPIDTPVLEYTEVLLGKGGGETDKQIFRFLDNGGREVAMRFDLTVPFARFLALHKNEIVFPFKRFHINKVWRGENPQKGRFREFMQCDFDIVGVDSPSADYEILSMMRSSFDLLGLGNVTFHVAHRGLFNAFLEHLGVSDDSVEVLRTVDKLRKIGSEAVRSQLTDLTGSVEKADDILAYINPKESDGFLARLERLSELAGNEQEHTHRMRTIYSLLEAAGIASQFVLDPSITRGLDYYTGIVYETFLDDLPSIGSVCSGGRYNDLASLYTKDRIPGVGSSIGLDRLLSALEELGSGILTEGSSADVLVVVMEESLRPWYHSVGDALRKLGIRCDVYLADKKISQQFKYAESNHIPFALTCGSDEHDAGTFTLKDLRTRETCSGLSLQQVAQRIRKD